MRVEEKRRTYRFDRPPLGAGDVTGGEKTIRFAAPSGSESVAAGVGDGGAPREEENCR
jgi:hypothetical protein